ncbi:MAG: glycosyl transferase [Spirochaetes bacterium GWF1_51_8]|nr:MAG: glycosyl transferase [Spirochaetes bacterium GWF1_51_8]
MKTAIVHEWLSTFAGAEKVLEEIYALYPSPVYTLFQDKESVAGSFLKDAEIRTTSLQKFPLVKKLYRKLLALFPRKIEEFDLREYDVVLSSSHSVAKGALTNTGQLHICYIHTPVRYAWDLYFRYLEEAGFKGIMRWYAAKVLHGLRTWDIISANRVDHFIANSENIARRVKKIYRRDAEVIYPPVDVDGFSLYEKKEDFYLTASRFVAYKKIDVIVEAFTKRPNRKLRVIGDGPDRKKIAKIAAGHPNIELLGYRPFAELKEQMQKAKGFVFAADEDFGIIPVEAQACGTPVIAFGAGGALETVKGGETGVFFAGQTPDSINDAVHDFEKKENKWDAKKIRKHAEKFSTAVFRHRFKEFVEAKYEEFRGGRKS